MSLYGHRILCLVQFLHWGKLSSHLMCRFLQVSQPLRDLVWLQKWSQHAAHHKSTLFDADEPSSGRTAAGTSHCIELLTDGRLVSSISSQ